MEKEKYIVFNYSDLTDECQKTLESLTANEIKTIEIKKGKTGYIFNQRPC